MSSFKSSPVFINQIAPAVPESEVHQMFIAQASSFFFGETRKAKLFEKLIEKSQIDRRYSVLRGKDAVLSENENGQFYQKTKFSGTQGRMLKYQQEALPLAKKALGSLRAKENLSDITHIIVTSCTGFYAPGLDVEIAKELGLPGSVERTMIGFMGCNAAFNAMKQASHIVRSAPNSRVLMINIELCSLHLEETEDLEKAMAYMLFADGCAASVISSESRGLEIKSFRSFIDHHQSEHIRWNIGDQGFNMFLSPSVPKVVQQVMSEKSSEVLLEKSVADYSLWALHPGGRAILDACQSALNLPDSKMFPSREVLREYGNMSSATIMFVLQKLLYDMQKEGDGIAVGFGPGLSIETMHFSKKPM